MVEELVVTVGAIVLLIVLIVLFVRQNRKEDKEQPPSPVVVEPPVIEPTPPVEPPIVEPPVVVEPPVIVPPVVVEPPVIVPPVVVEPPLPEGIRKWPDGQWWFNNEFYPTLEAAIAAKADYERRLIEREENLRRGEQELVNQRFTGILFAAGLNLEDLAYLYAMSHSIRMKYPTNPNLYYNMGLLSGSFHDIARAINDGELALVGKPVDFTQTYSGILKPYLETILQTGHL